MIKPITTFVIAALAIATFAQSQTVKIKSKGEDIRTVIDSIFEQTGKQYVLETNFHQSLYMNIDGISFQKAIDIISNITDMEFEEKLGIWYIHKKPISSPHVFAPVVSHVVTVVPVKKAAILKKGKATPKATLVPKAVTKTQISKTNAPAKSINTQKPKPLAKTKPDPDKTESAGESFTNTTPIVANAPAVKLTGRITVQLKKMDIREVFAEFGRQANVNIEFDDAVPNYKLDASFYNTTLKFALDKVCKVAHLKYAVSPNNTLRITKI